eukprot:6126640-Amphidinium_carterae.1
MENSKICTFNQSRMSAGTVHWWGKQKRKRVYARDSHHVAPATAALSHGNELELTARREV